MTKPKRYGVLLALVAVVAAGLGAAYLGSRAVAAPEASSPAAGGAQPTDAEEPAGDDAKSTSFPVVTVAPVRRNFPQTVLGYGTWQADVRSARSVSMATLGVVRSIAVLPGERVRRGQPLFVVEPDPLAYLAYQQAASAAKLARAEVERLRAQRADNLATASQLETAEKALADAQAGLDAGLRQGAAGASEVLRAPADGIVSAIGVGIGDRPAMGSVLATLVPDGPVGLTIGVEPGEARRLRPGNRVRLRAAMAGAPDRAGHVTVVGAALDKVTRLVPVGITLDNPGFGDVPVGSAVEAEIAAGAVTAFAVPRAAVIRDEEGTAVFEIVGGHAHRVPVVIEVDEGGHLGLSGALDPARRVATNGAYELEDGVAVTEARP